MSVGGVNSGFNINPIKQDSTVINNTKNIVKTGEVKTQENISPSKKDINGVNPNLATKGLKDGLSFNFVEAKPVSHFNDKKFLESINVAKGGLEHIAGNLIKEFHKMF